MKTRTNNGSIINITPPGPTKKPKDCVHEHPNGKNAKISVGFHTSFCTLCGREWGEV